MTQRGVSRHDVIPDVHGVIPDLIGDLKNEIL